MPDFAPGELPGDGGQGVLQSNMGRRHVEVCANPVQWGELPVCFNGTLVLFPSPAHGCPGDLSVASFQSKFV